MPTYQVAWNATTKTAKIQPDGAAVGAGFTDIGSFDHNNDVDDELGVDANHVYYHHVRDLLYAQDVLNMQDVSIIIPVATVSGGADFTLDISNGDTRNLAPVVTPPGATNQAMTYASADPTKATVDANGLVKPVAAGSSVITITSVDTGVTDTVTVTVQA